MGVVTIFKHFDLTTIWNRNVVHVKYVCGLLALPFSPLNSQGFAADLKNFNVFWQL